MDIIEKESFMDEDIQGFTKILEHFGFLEVRVEKVPLPQYIIDWIKTEEDEEDMKDFEAAVLDGEIVYLRASTNLGSFGIFIMAYPALDLTETGFTLKDLMGSEMEGVSDGFALCEFSEEAVHELKKLLEKKQAKTK